MLKLTKEIYTNSQLRGVLTAAAMNTENNRMLMDMYLGKGQAAAIDSIAEHYNTLLGSAKTAQDSIKGGMSE